MKVFKEIDGTLEDYKNLFFEKRDIELNLLDYSSFSESGFYAPEIIKNRITAMFR